MKKLIITAAAIAIFGATPLMAQASPKEDLKKFRNYFFQMNPGVKLQDYADGIYALDKARRDEWENMMEFPPFDQGLEIGEKSFKKYNVASCFKNGGIGIKQMYPYFDKKDGTVHTMEGDLWACLKKNKVDTKAEKLSLGKGKFAAMAAYMAYTSRGKAINVNVDPDPRSMAIYNEGKNFFYAKRGQLNFSCADCHIYNQGMMARGNLLSPALGQTSHFPAWRRKWAAGKEDNPTSGFGTIQRRYSGCNKQVRAKALNDYDKKYKNEQHPTYVALEYFHTYMSNGIKLNGPSVRQ